MKSEWVLEVSQVAKRFPKAEALKNVSFHLATGQILGLLGPNGSGKSTLLRCIAGLHKIDRGVIKIQGLPPSRETKSLVSFLPEINHLYRWMRVGEILDYYGSFFSDWDFDLSQEFLSFMKLEKDKKVGSLSKGMTARLKIILGISRRAPLLLMDEPLSGIDPASRGRIVEAIVAKVSTASQALILSTHEISDSELLFCRVLFLHKGEVTILEEAETLREKHGKSITDLFKEVFLEWA